VEKGFYDSALTGLIDESHLNIIAERMMKVFIL